MAILGSYEEMFPNSFYDVDDNKYNLPLKWFCYYEDKINKNEISMQYIKQNQNRVISILIKVSNVDYTVNYYKKDWSDKRTAIVLKKIILFFDELEKQKTVIDKAITYIDLIEKIIIMGGN